MTEKLDEIEKRIRDHEKRITELEKNVFEKRTKPERKLKPEGLPDRILALRASNFFGEPRTDAEVHSEIVKTYPCDLNRVSVALFRLSKKKELRKTTKVGEDKDHVAYAW
jgi:hypothetical protein